MTARRSRLIYTVVAAVWLVVIAYSSINPGRVGAGPGVLWAPVAAHMGAYAALGVLWAGSLRAVLGERVKLLLITVLAWVFATTWGIAMEVLQLAVPGRYAEWEDIGWNAIGAGLGLGALAMWRATRWERTGEWDGSGWHLHESSEGLMDWLSRKERENPDVWRVAAEAGQRITIRGKHFDYRLTSRGAGLMMDRRPR